jgi:hypothetical protein
MLCTDEKLCCQTPIKTTPNFSTEPLVHSPGKKSTFIQNWGETQTSSKTALWSGLK